MRAGPAADPTALELERDRVRHFDHRSRRDALSARERAERIFTIHGADEAY
jgi:hypothetical protein